MYSLSINVVGITRAFQFISGLPSVADSPCNEMERIEIVTVWTLNIISLYLVENTGSSSSSTGSQISSSIAYSITSLHYAWWLRLWRWNQMQYLVTLMQPANLYHLRVTTRDKSSNNGYVPRQPTSFSAVLFDVQLNESMKVSHAVGASNLIAK